MALYILCVKYNTRITSKILYIIYLYNGISQKKLILLINVSKRNAFIIDSKLINLG